MRFGRTYDRRPRPPLFPRPPSAPPTFRREDFGWTAAESRRLDNSPGSAQPLPPTGLVLVIRPPAVASCALRKIDLLGLLGQHDIRPLVAAGIRLGDLCRLQRASRAAWSVAHEARREYRGDKPILCVLGGEVLIETAARKKLKPSSTACLFCPRAKSWQTDEVLPRMSTQRMGPAAVVADNCLYVCGGFCGKGGKTELDTAEKFQNGVWRSLPRMRNRRIGPALLAVDQHLYVCGGCNGQKHLKSVERLDLSLLDAAQWEQLAAQMSGGRSEFGAGVIQNSIHVCGGCGEGNVALQTAECLSATWHWTQLPAMSRKRAAPAATVAGGYLYVFGGDSGEGILGSVERLDPVSRRWERVGPEMATPRCRHAAVALDGCIYICGGQGAHGDADIFNSVARFDPKLGSWEELACMPIPRTGIAVVVMHMVSLVSRS